MPRITVTRTIQAPVELVFETVSDIRNFSQAVPHIVNVEFLSDVRSGLGTRFRETRRTKGKEMSTELEVTEYVPNDRVRMVADSHGTVWDSLFTVKEAGKVTEMQMTMDARAHKLLPKLINPLIMKMVAKAVESDMDSVKQYCEQAAKER